MASNNIPAKIANRDVEVKEIRFVGILDPESMNVFMVRADEASKVRTSMAR